MTPPETRYARSGELRIAYQVVGSGSLNRVLVPGFVSNLNLWWEEPTWSKFSRASPPFHGSQFFSTSVGPVCQTAWRISRTSRTATIRQAEVGEAKTTLDRTAEQFEVAPSRLVADAGSARPR